MRKLFRLPRAGLLALALPASAANLSVAFVRPERYTDAGYASALASERERGELQREIEQHLQRLAERSLPASDALMIEVLDIGPLGAISLPQQLRRAGRARGHPSRIKLRYTLRRGDQVIASAEEHLSDMNFLMPRMRYASGDRLRYEKAMLDDWFQREISHR